MSKALSPVAAARKDRPPRWRETPGLGTYALAILVFLYAPLAILTVYSLNAGSLITVWEGLSLKWYAAVLANADLHRAALNSLMVAACASLVATALALPASLGIERFRASRAVVAERFISLPLVVPEIVTAVTTLAFFSALGLKLGLGNLIVAHVVFCIPFAMMPMRARLHGMGNLLQLAAADLYAPPWAVFYRVTLPLMAPAILSGAALAFLVSLDDFVLSALLGDAGTTTLPVYIYGMIRRGITPEVNAVSTLLLAASLALAVAALLLDRRARKSPTNP